MKIRARINLICILCLLVFNFKSYGKTVVVKVNAMRGENFATPNIDKQLLEKMVAEGFEKRQYTVFTDRTGLEDLEIDQKEIYFADLFVYQFPADHPAVTLTFRSEAGVHVLLKEKKLLYLDRKETIQNLVQNVLSRLPEQIDFTQVQQVNTKLIFESSQAGLNLNRGMAQLIMSNYRSKYRISLETDDNDVTIFPFGEFKDYFAYCVNFEGYRKLLKDEGVVVSIKINKLGFTSVDTIHDSTKIKEKNSRKIFQAVSEIPLLENRTGKELKGIITLGIN